MRNTESNETKLLKKPVWPRIKPIRHRSYQAFYSRIIDLHSGTYYPERDLAGNVIEPSDGGPRARYLIHNILRVRSYSGKEYLYSSGVILGFNSLGGVVYHPMHKSEVYNRTHWHKERNYNSKTGRIEEIVKSPSNQEEVYLLPFSPEAVDELFKHSIKPDTPAVYRRDNKRTIDRPCNFVVRDERSGVNIAVEWGNIRRTLELFKTKSFEYLFNAEYIPEPVKAEMRAMSEGLTGEKVQASPKISDNNNSSANTAGPANNNNNNSKDFQQYK